VSYHHSVLSLNLLNSHSVWIQFDKTSKSLDHLHCSIDVAQHVAEPVCFAIRLLSQIAPSKRKIYIDYDYP